MNFDLDDVAVENACMCQICGCTAHKLKCGVFQCVGNTNHAADGHVGIWSDLTYPAMDEVDEAPQGFTKETFKKFVAGMVKEPLMVFTSDMHMGQVVEKDLTKEYSSFVLAEKKKKEVLPQPRSAWGKAIKEKLDKMRGKG